jgi:hypothetical protein
LEIKYKEKKNEGAETRKVFTTEEWEVNSASRKATSKLFLAKGKESRGIWGERKIEGRVS